MEIIRSSRYLPVRSRSRHATVVMGQVVLPSREPVEPSKNGRRVISDELGDLEEITAQLEEAGDTLEYDPTLDNFICFRNSVGRFARRVTRMAYSMERVFTTRQSAHLVTSVTDEKGDYLYRTTMNGQQMHFHLASEIGDIRGMILQNSV